ncbi:hypothetical protein HY498_01125 [Candidatus Woesearchaeota archaeon]|nr:hypothetical protein [Candidatus Woesearchaeota archaeon]
MVKFAETAKRLFGNTFVCRNCKTKIRGIPTKIMKGEIPCKRCSKRRFRPVRKK